MSESSLPPPSADDLQFNKAEPADPNSSLASPEKHCVVCNQPIVSAYFALGDQVLCPTCAAQVNAPPTGTGIGRLIKATFFGLGAGLIGTLIWLLIRRMAHLEIGLVAILVGFMVGKAVHKGSGNRGGLAYQVLAVLLTYSCIAANYMPDIFEGLMAQVHEARAEAANADNKANPPANPAEEHVAERVAEKADLEQPVNVGEAFGALAMLIVLVFGIALTVPFYDIKENLIGLLIIGFALWEAWKFNQYRPLQISGPYQMGSAPTA